MKLTIFNYYEETDLDLDSCSDEAFWEHVDTAIELGIYLPFGNA